MQQSRRLVLIRHAKAEHDGPTDAERPLAETGHRDAAAGGRWLAAAGHTPDHALVSAARRARETWAGLADGGDWTVDPDVSGLLYSAEPGTVLDLLREVPPEAQCVVVVGHNPTVGQLAHLIDDGEGNEAAGRELAGGGFPTCSLAVFEYAGEWADLDLTSASLLAFGVGRA